MKALANMNSCLYSCEVIHQRLAPQRHRFSYRIFMFWIDLDEVSAITSRFLLMSRDAFNVFSFRDKHYARYTNENPRKTARERIIDFLAARHIDVAGDRIMLLTHLQTLGYIFNPVSFYVCYRADGSAHCAVAEVTNTFGEMKQYVLDAESLRNDRFEIWVGKNFYVSPFSQPDDVFNFVIHVPGNELLIRVDDYQDDERMLVSALAGKRKALTNLRLLYYTLRFPFITLGVIGSIHWQAMILWLKRVPFFRKAHLLHEQKEMVKL